MSGDDGLRAIGLAVLAIGLSVLPALGGEPNSTFARIRARMIAESLGEVSRFAQIRQRMIADSIGDIMHNGRKSVEVVTFADPARRPVTVIRGPSAPPPAGLPPGIKGKVEIVHFADSGRPAVTVIRGTATAAPASPWEELFAPASAAELDLVAFAVDGAESSHGTNLGMWRPEWSGPQGPMQVSEAAAVDVGGGDRFDIYQNRLLGRAYLAHLFRRYGNWPDAVAAYNWGPGNVDAWILGGRPLDGLPIEVERYCERVLRDAGLRRGLDLPLAPSLPEGGLLAP
jgi:hypothetical protein